MMHRFTFACKNMKRVERIAFHLARRYGNESNQDDIYQVAWMAALEVLPKLDYLVWKYFWKAMKYRVLSFLHPDRADIYRKREACEFQEESFHAENSVEEDIDMWRVLQKYPDMMSPRALVRKRAYSRFYRARKQEVTR